MLARLTPLATLILTGCFAGEQARSSPAVVQGGSNIGKSGAAEQAFASCPGASALATAADVSWAPQTSRLPDHRTLRERMKTSFPKGPRRILFWSSGMHHTRVSFSVVAVRDTQGRWRTSGIGEEGPGLLAIEPRPLQRLERKLSPEESRNLDQALADRCLYASPTFQRDAGIASGGSVQTLEVETPEQRWVSSWFGVRTPQQEAVISLISQ